MTKCPASILFLGKKDDPYCLKALEETIEKFTVVESYLSAWGDPRPEAFENWKGDYVISYLSRWIIPQGLIDRAQIAAFNLHPAPPEYPGIGCNNFALYDNAETYGVTCHHMDATVDTGKIIAVKRFPMTSEDTVKTLLDQTYKVQLELYREVLEIMFEGKALPTSEEHWTRKPYTRKEFDALMELGADMSPEEIKKRVRATSYGKFQPSLKLHGFTFEYKETIE